MNVMCTRSIVLTPLFLFIVGATAGGAGAAQPRPWQMGFQPAASPVMRHITDFHNLLLVISVLICLVVLGLLAYVMARFNEKANPTPSKTTHNTIVEVLWTALPVLILVIIAVPSFKLLYFMDRTQNPEMTIKATGHQWYWSYDYPDHGNFTFDAAMVPEGELKEGQLRLLEADNRVVLPVDTDIRVLLTSDDVIHNWAVPSLGLKLDTVPGRINETWVRIERKGTFYGQCSELCGINHAYMPIVIEAVSKAAFAEWVEKAKREFAGTEPNSLRVAGRRANRQR